MHVDNILSLGPANSILTCRTSIFITSVSPPQRSVNGTHYRYCPSYTFPTLPQIAKDQFRHQEYLYLPMYSQGMPNTCL